MTNPTDQPSESNPQSYAGLDTPAADLTRPGAEPLAPAVPSDDALDGTAPEPGTTPRPAPGFDQKGNVRRTRVSGVWIGLIGTALFLVLLIIFIAQNSRQVPLHFFGWSGQFSLALTIVLSAVIGILIVAIPGSVRILQLRRALRKNVPGDQRGAR